MVPSLGNVCASSRPPSAAIYRESRLVEHKKCQTLEPFQGLEVGRGGWMGDDFKVDVLKQALKTQRSEAQQREEALQSQLNGLWQVMCCICSFASHCSRP